ncbi:hypothetical protein HON36_03935 [Candidatus Parcubacteria bacterium]|jgi:hypothetical protein|nr:hypothetical protein [Candidatus Parcubacteria bacterium]MBT7228945.1 hypothetical protein [Candidatus Parcubacteria bacterium]
MFKFGKGNEAPPVAEATLVEGDPVEGSAFDQVAEELELDDQGKARLEGALEGRIMLDAEEVEKLAKRLEGLRDGVLIAGAYAGIIVGIVGLIKMLGSTNDVAMHAGGDKMGMGGTAFIMTAGIMNAIDADRDFSKPGNLATKSAKGMLAARDKARQFFGVHSEGTIEQTS